MRQIAFSDMVVLNKIDLVDENSLQEVRDWIDNRMNRVRIVETVQCDVPLEILLGVGRFEPDQLSKYSTDHDHESNHRETFSTWSFETTRPISLKALNEMVKKRLPANVYRCKGVIYTADNPESRTVLQVVGRRADVSMLDEWGERQPRTQIVAIGSKGSIDPEELSALFESCTLEMEATEIKD